MKIPEYKSFDGRNNSKIEGEVYADLSFKDKKMSFTERMNWDEYYMNLAFDAAKKSKCVRAKYGSVLVSAQNRVLSIGFNGKPAGSRNDHICYREGMPDNAAKPNCCLHSEVNCLLYSDPIDRFGGSLYVSGIPCTDCLLVIFQSGVSKLVFYDGPSESGHKGNFSWDFVGAYGFMDRITIIPFRYEETSILK
jgi:dCMP deaminase